MCDQSFTSLCYHLKSHSALIARLYLNAYLRHEVIKVL